MKFILCLLVFLPIAFSDIRARAILPGDTSSYSLAVSSAFTVEAMGLPKLRQSVEVLSRESLQEVRENPLVAFPKPFLPFETTNGRVKNRDQQVSAEWVLDLEAHPNYVGDITNTRVRNVYSLEDIVESILIFKRDNPDSNPWAVFDLDEMLTITANRTLSDGGQQRVKVAIHPKTNELLKALKDENIPVMILSMASGAKDKLKEAGIVIDGVFDHICDNVSADGGMKGVVLKDYINSLTDDTRRPSHVFFSDDSDGRGFISSVEVSLLEMEIPYTTFHFFGDKILSYKQLSQFGAFEGFKPALNRDAKRRGMRLKEYDRLVLDSSV